MSKKTKKTIALIVLIAVAITTVLSVVLTVSAKEKHSTAYVFIGDSRTVGMDQTIHMSNMADTFVIAKSGMGYNWWKNTGSSQLADIRTNNKDYTSWIYIFNLGVNDLANIDLYKTLIPELEKEATVYFISINPTIDAVKGIQCAEIEKFNNSIKPVCSNYINSYDYLKYIGYAAKDGMHYDPDTYSNLYEYIMLKIAMEEFINAKDNPNLIRAYLNT